MSLQTEMHKVYNLASKTLKQIKELPNLRSKQKVVMSIKGEDILSDSKKRTAAYNDIRHHDKPLRVKK